MTYPVYSEYEDSGAEWLGKIPRHWSVLPLKRKYRIVGGSTPPAGDENWNGDIVWVTPADLSQLANFDIVDSKRKISETGLHSCGVSLVAKGSIVLSTRAPIGSLGIAKLSLTTNQGCKALVPTGPVCSRFHAYQLSTLKKELNVRGRGSTFMELSREELGVVSITFPPVEEQQKIAAFLDRKTAEIDTLIAKKRRLLDRLAEKRTALITRAVTKGLNPDAPMKDSGIEWLGEIPAHWEVRRLKQLIAEPFKNGIFKKKEHWGAGTPIINVGDLYSGNEVNADRLDRLECSEEEKRKYDSSIGDFFFVRSSLKLDGIGKSASLLKKIEPTVFECHIVRGRPMTELVEPRFLSFVLNSTYARAWFVAAANTVTMATIDQSKVKELVIGLPNYSEQEQIADFIELSMHRLDHVSGRVCSVVEALQEYRSALITNAVTGQIKVA